MNKIKSLPVQAWNALGPGHISKHSLSHTQMHNFLTQTINAGIPRHWQHNAKITSYNCNRIAKDSCWWQAKSLTFFLWRHLGPWSHHSSPELLRVGGTAGGVLREETVTRKYGLEKSYASTVFVLIQGVKMWEENGQQCWGRNEFISKCYQTMDRCYLTSPLQPCINKDCKKPAVLNINSCTMTEKCQFGGQEQMFWPVIC